VIDWRSLLANSAWVLGCALLLAILSYTSWLAWLNGEKFSLQLKKPVVRSSFAWSFALVCIGLAGTSHTWWEIALWLLLAFFMLVEGVIYWRQHDLREM
jgi:hypothetical protein